MKCYNSGFADDFSEKSVWEKRETSLSIEEVKELNCQEMKWLSAFSPLVWKNVIL